MSSSKKVFFTFFFIFLNLFKVKRKGETRKNAFYYPRDCLPVGVGNYVRDYIR